MDFSVVNTETNTCLQLGDSKDAELQIWKNCECGGVTLKLYMDFQLHVRPVPVTTASLSVSVL